MLKICSLFLTVILFLGLVTGCSRTTTVTMTPSPVTVTATKTVSPSQAAVITSTQPSAGATTTVTVVTTVTPTLTTSLYQGTLNCTYTGQANGVAQNGTFSIKIDANGDITGSITGAVVDSIVGNVNLAGDLIAIGVVSTSGSTLAASYAAHITLSGNTMSVQGNYAGGSSTGTFSGTGTVTH